LIGRRVDRAVPSRTGGAPAVNADRLINILASVTLVELMLTIGLGATVADVWAVVRDWRGATRALVANYVLVPAAGVGLVLLFRAQPTVAAGVMVVAVCPGAPYGPPFTGIAKGDVARAIGLMVLLAGSSALLAPLLLQLLLPLVAPGGQAKADALGIVKTLALVQFLPLCAGLGVAAYRPALARRLKRPLGQLSALLGLALIAIVLVAQFRLLSVIRPRGYAGMLALVAASAAAGWLLGGRSAAARKTLAITTSVRNVGVGLVIAGGSFPGTPAVTFTTAYAIFQTVLVAVAVLALGRRAGASAVTPLVPAATVAQNAEHAAVVTT
jgi:BASS family bile acid:Na+ symporter